ncbi:MAG: hypothetical protein EZS28_017140, partial [Streblomastix strix]
MQIEVEENFNRLVKENEGIDDPRFSTIQTSLPPPIDPQRIQRMQDHNVNARLNEAGSQMGSMAPPPDPDTQFKQLGEEAPKEYEQILKQTDVEQQPFTYPAEEDALQQQIFDNDYDQNRPAQYPQSAPARAEDQMSENLQAANDEVINGLKYLVGSTGWGKQPINAYFNRQHFPDRTFQWYTNEGQTVLRQAKVKL